MPKIFLTLFVMAGLSLAAQPKAGEWRGVLLLNKEKQLELPFTFEVVRLKGATQLIIHNAEERIIVSETSFAKDSFYFKMPVFDTEFRTKLDGDTMLTGLWINHTKKENNAIPFSASFGNRSRFKAISTKPGILFYGKWEV
ncbi:MAG: hypothetical protein O9353_06635, partial [Bacteroidia bacterium]|nr:hypothetical protein [Bacteroidia bacterium]